MKRYSRGFALFFIILVIFLVAGILFVWFVTNSPINIPNKNLTSDLTNTTEPSPTSYQPKNCSPDPVENVVVQQKEILAAFENETTIVYITNQIGNFAVLDEHGRPPKYHGGGWCVVKKECGVWTEVFCSQDENWCGTEEHYNLPKGLLEKCVSTPTP